MTSRIDSLLAGRYTVKPFAELPAPSQLAIIWFMAIDGRAWDAVELPALSEKNAQAALEELLPAFVEEYGETLFGEASLVSTAVRDAVMRDPEIAEGFASWEEYHGWYLDSGVPEHPESNRWPVILSEDNSETLRDGWHRFHSYMRAGASIIPAVFFPPIAPLDRTL